MKKNYLTLTLLLLLSLFLVACSKGNTLAPEAGKEEQKEKSGSKALQVNDLDLQETPERIVSLTAGDLNTLLALGIEPVGRPIIRAKISEEVEKIETIGTSNEVNIEKIISLSPDLVIAHPQLNKEAIPTLEQAGIQVFQTGANSIEEVKESIHLIGKIVDRESEAEQIISGIDQQLKELKESKSTALRTLVVFGIAGNWMAALPDSLSGDILEAVGHYNIAKDYPSLERFPQYAQLDAEKIVEADPEVILFVTPGPYKETIQAFTKEMEENPAWHSIQAVKNDQFIHLPNEWFGANPGSEISKSLAFLAQEMETALDQYEKAQ